MELDTRRNRFAALMADDNVYGEAFGRERNRLAAYRRIHVADGLGIRARIFRKMQHVYLLILLKAAALHRNLYVHAALGLVNHTVVRGGNNLNVKYTRKADFFGIHADLGGRSVDIRVITGIAGQNLVHEKLGAVHRNSGCILISNLNRIGRIIGTGDGLTEHLPVIRRRTKTPCSCPIHCGGTAHGSEHHHDYHQNCQKTFHFVLSLSKSSQDKVRYHAGYHNAEHKRCPFVDEYHRFMHVLRYDIDYN